MSEIDFSNTVESNVFQLYKLFYALNNKGEREIISGSINSIEALDRYVKEDSLDLQAVDHPAKHTSTHFIAPSTYGSAWFEKNFSHPEKSSAAHKLTGNETKANADLIALGRIFYGTEDGHVEYYRGVYPDSGGEIKFGKLHIDLTDVVLGERIKAYLKANPQLEKLAAEAVVKDAEQQVDEVVEAFKRVAAELPPETRASFVQRLADSLDVNIAGISGAISSGRVMVG